MTDSERLLTAGEVGRLLGVRPKYVHEMGRTGAIPRVEVGPR